MVRTCIFLAVSIWLCQTAIAQEAEMKRIMQVANNYSHQNTICAAYHYLMAVCLAKDRPKDGLAAKFKTIGDDFIDRSVKLGQIAEVSPKAIDARMQLATQEMMEDVENNCANTSVVTLKHAKKCTDLYNNGAKYLQDALGPAK